MPITANRCCIRANAACSSRYDLAQIGIRLDARRQRIPDGVYRDLKIELANGFHVSGAEGRPIHTQFKPKGDATVLRMSGSLLVENGTARPLALALDTADAAAGRGGYTMAGDDHVGERRFIKRKLRRYRAVEHEDE